MDLVTGILVEALPCLGGEEEILAMARHPGSDTQFGVAIARRGVAMIQTVLEQDVQHAIGFCLCCPAERRSAKERHRAHVSRASKGAFFNHKILLLLMRARACAMQDDNTAECQRL